MKKVILLGLLLCSCVGLTTQPVPPKTIRNPDCFPSHELKVFQVNDKYSLIQLYYCHPADGDTDVARSCKARRQQMFGGEVFGKQNQKNCMMDIRLHLGHIVWY